MAENDAPQQQFAIQRIYTKDISFETPASPAIFTKEWKPEVNVDLNTRATSVAEAAYEIVLTVTVTAKLGEETAYLAEVQQAGIFIIGGFNEKDLGAMINSYCPNILFPYAREAISDLITRGSFPQMLLAPVNFDALYADHLKRQQEGVDASEATH